MYIQSKIFTAVVEIMTFVFLGTLIVIEMDDADEKCKEQYKVQVCEKVTEWKPIYSTESK